MIPAPHYISRDTSQIEGWLVHFGVQKFLSCCHPNPSGMAVDHWTEHQLDPMTLSIGCLRASAVGDKFLTDLPFIANRSRRAVLRVFNSSSAPYRRTIRSSEIRKILGEIMIGDIILETTVASSNPFQIFRALSFPLETNVDTELHPVNALKPKWASAVVTQHPVSH